MEKREDGITIQGVASTVIYQNPENGYAVLRVDVAGETVTCVGCMPGISPGEELELTGRWKEHTSYGQQFQADYVVRRLPTGTAAIFRYLAAGSLKYVGPAKAREIVDRFGSRTLEVLENDPLRLAEIRGISEKRAAEIGEAFRRQICLRRLMEMLNQYGVRPFVAVQMYHHAGEQAIEMVRENPYVLTAFGAEFFEADAMALDMGFEGDSPQRMEAALLFELAHNMNNGHVFLPRRKLVEATAQLLDTQTEPVEEALSVLYETGDVILEEVAGQEACYLEELYRAERDAAVRLTEMAGNTAFPDERTHQLIDRIEREQAVVYSQGQRTAVEKAASNRVMVLTGGPGTGKTTCVRGILALFDHMHVRTLLCAPTGRAAKRLSEVCRREAATIHRMLGVTPGEGETLRFDHNEDDPLECDAVIVDETSMVDILLFSSLLRALPPGCRLILVGDADQLPSVGPGNVFGDVIRSGAVCTVRLTEIFRQAESSKIVRTAHQINGGTVPEWKNEGGDLFFLRRSDVNRAAETVLELCRERLPENMGIPMGEIQVLCPSRKQELGTENLNRRLQEALNPPDKGKREKSWGDFVFREGDKVMQTRNDYDIMWKSPDGRVVGNGVFNGDVGVIRAIDQQRETVTVDYDDKQVSYMFEQLGELEPAWALTVHKAQGSEYRAVVLVCLDASPRLLTRSVLYTAITRARELLVIVGNEGILTRMVENNRRSRRYSGLRARLADGLLTPPDRIQ
ncbi:MAG: ATP-dependent RecD-like DNA helicase [Oscillospiraceae bacterium]|nr:ATP-dependent RecD-like DNA helicase [Oscillospiraceae bacterium]